MFKAKDKNYFHGNRIAQSVFIYQKRYMEFFGENAYALCFFLLLLFMLIFRNLCFETRTKKN